jgi:O-antigen/teichoic acid export membrane protein
MILRLHNVFRLLRLNIVLAAINFGTSIILARGLGAEARGQFAILVMWISIVGYIALCGTHLFLARRAGAEPNMAGVVYSRALTILRITLFPSILIFAAVAFVVTRFSTPVVSPYAWAIAAGVLPFGMWNTLQMQIELGRNRLDCYIFTQITFAIGQACIIGMLFVSGYHDLIKYISATLASAIFTCLITQSIISGDLPRNEGDSALPPPLSVIFAARRDALATWLLLLVSMADRLFVSLLFPAKVFGVYIVAIALSHLQNLAAEATAPLFFARSARDHASKAQDYGTLAERLRQTVLINAVAAIALLTIAPIMLPLVYGPQYSSGLGLVYFIVPAFAIKSMMRPYEEVLRGADRSVQQSAVSLGMLLAFAASAAVAAHLEWVGGVALSLMISSIVGLFLVVRAVAAKTGLTLKELLLPRLHDAINLLREFVFHARGMVRGY